MQDTTIYPYPIYSLIQASLFLSFFIILVVSREKFGRVGPNREQYVKMGTVFILSVALFLVIYPIIQSYLQVLILFPPALFWLLMFIGAVGFRKNHVSDSQSLSASEPVLEDEYHGEEIESLRYERRRRRSG